MAICLFISSKCPLFTAVWLTLFPYIIESFQLNTIKNLTWPFTAICEGVEFLVFTKTENHQSTEESIMLANDRFMVCTNTGGGYQLSTASPQLVHDCVFSVSFDRSFLKMIDSSLRALFFIAGGGNLEGQHIVGTVIPTLIGFYLQSSKVSFFFRGGHSQTSASIWPRPLYPLLSHQVTSHPLLPHP